MSEFLTVELGVAVLAMVLIDLVVNPEPVLVLRRRVEGQGAASLLDRAWGAALMIAARLAIGALLYWLSQRDQALTQIGTFPLSLAGAVMIAAGVLLLVRALSEIVQLSYRRFVAAADNVPARLAPGGMAMAAILAAVEPAVLGLGLAASLTSLLVGLTLGAVLLLILARPMALAINRFPHLRLLGLAGVAIIGGALILSAPGTPYPHVVIQGVVLALAAIGLVASFLARRSGADPGLEIIAPELYGLREPPLREPRSQPDRGGFERDAPARHRTTGDREPHFADDEWRAPTPQVHDDEPERPRRSYEIAAGTVAGAAALSAPSILSPAHDVPQDDVPQDDDTQGEDDLTGGEGSDDAPALESLEPQAKEEALGTLDDWPETGDSVADQSLDAAIARPVNPMEPGVEEPEYIPQDPAPSAEPESAAEHDEDGHDDAETPTSDFDVTLEAGDRPVPQRQRERPRPLRGPARRRMARKDKRRP